MYVYMLYLHVYMCIHICAMFPYIPDLAIV